jgi:hypothetical protein
MSHETRKLIDFLVIEQMNHAGEENGNLKATYDQLEAYGIRRSKIRDAIEEAEAVGLLRCERGGRYAGSNQPSTYRLTFYGTRDGNSPTNDWKKTTEEDVKAHREECRARKKLKKARKSKGFLCVIGGSQK